MRLSYRTRFISVFLSLIALLAIMSFGAHILAIWNWNNSQIMKYADNAIYRAELLVDNTISEVREATAVADITCNGTLLKSLRQTAYLHGIIQDIRVKADGRNCWAFGNRDLPINRLVDETARIPGKNPVYRLLVLNSKEIGSFGIEWEEAQGKTIIALVSAGQLLYDILPPEIRESADIHIGLADGTTFARYSAHEAEPALHDNITVFKASSSRYPLEAMLHVRSDTLWTWNRTYPAYVVLPWMAALVAISFFITRGLVRDEGFAGELELAIARKEIVPFYQPIFDLKTGAPVGFEMLARWITQDGQIIPPDKFIPFAEETGRINGITCLLLSTAGAEIGHLLRNQPHLKFSFNITPDQYLADGFVNNLTQTLDRAGIPATSAIIEVTERQSIEDSGVSENVSRALAEAGIRIAIDDAGTGHNGLSSIHSLDANFLKIDKYFIDALLVDQKSSTIIEMLTSVAKAFHMTVVAEGIETGDQARMLTELGIEQGQGYFFSKPVPASKLLARLSTDSALSNA